MVGYIGFMHRHFAGAVGLLFLAACRTAPAAHDQLLVVSVAEPTSAPVLPAPTPQVPSAIASTPPPSPSSDPLPLPAEDDCDPGGTPSLCVPPNATVGAHATGTPCGEAPSDDICRACRPVFTSFTGGQCCYVGLSRLPACRD